MVLGEQVANLSYKVYIINSNNIYMHQSSSYQYFIILHIANNGYAFYYVWSEFEQQE